MTVTTEKPVPAITRDSEEFWNFATDHKLMLRSCNDCGTLMYYPRVVCTNCLSQNLGWREARGGGIVHAKTIVYRAPNEAFRAEVPYVVAIVELDEGPRLMTNILGSEPAAVETGMRVELIFEERGDIALPQFRLAVA